MRRRGFSLLELLVAITIFALVLGAAGRLMVETQKAFVAQREASGVLAPLRQAENVLTELLQGSGANPSGITSVTAPRVLPGVYIRSQSGRTGYLRIVSDLTLPLGTSLDQEFEDVETWVGTDSTLWVSWANVGGGTPAPAQAVARPITNVQYTFLAADNTTISTAANARVTGASSVRIRITAPRPGRPTVNVEREVWVLLRNQ